MEEESRGRCDGCIRSLQSFGSFLYNSEEKTVLGRTGKSWALIGLFYLVFYTLLAGFFTGMLTVFLKSVLDPSIPKLTGKQSLLKLTPGLSFFPLPNYKSTLIRYNPRVNNSYVPYISSIQGRMKKMRENSIKPNAEFADCDANNDTKVPNDPLKLCQFKESILGSCKPPDYGFLSGKPCIFVKLNKIYGWIPDVRDNTRNPYISCNGETPADKENIGELKYFPPTNVNNGTYAKISNIYFPFLNQDAYVPPIAAIQFANLKKNVMIMVRCYLRGLKDESLSVRLEILLED